MENTTDQKINIIEKAANVLYKHLFKIEIIFGLFFMLSIFYRPINKDLSHQFIIFDLSILATIYWLITNIKHGIQVAGFVWKISFGGFAISVLGISFYFNHYPYGSDMLGLGFVLISLATVIVLIFKKKFPDFLPDNKVMSLLLRSVMMMIFIILSFFIE